MNILKAVLFGTAAFACFCVGLAFLQLREAVIRFDSGGANELVAESRKLVKTVADGYNDTYYDQKATLESTAVLVRTANETLDRMNGGLFGKAGLVPASRDTLVTLNQAIQAGSADLSKLGAQVHAAALEPLKTNLDNLAALSADLDREVKVKSPQVDKTLVSLTRAVDDLDKLLADPNVAKTLASVEGTAHNLDESTKSVEVALRPLREKATWLKKVLLTAAGFFRITIPVR